MSRATVAGLCVLALTGCASFVNEPTHPMRLDTLTPQGQAVSGADCRLTNEHGTQQARSGETSQVRRSNRDMDIVCRHPDQPDARARAVSRANAGLAGNIILGGAIGAVIDHSKGTAYTYPTWVQLVFGKSLVFDRRNEQDGQPLRGDEAAPTASTPNPTPTPTEKK